MCFQTLIFLAINRKVDIKHNLLGNREKDDFSSKNAHTHEVFSKDEKTPHYAYAQHLEETLAYCRNSFAIEK